jgi:hypothetical protein
VGSRDRSEPERPVRRIEQRSRAVRDRFGLLLLLLIGSFMTLASADSGWARVIAGMLQVAALVVAFLSTGLLVEHHWLGIFAAVGVIALVLTAASNDIAAGIGAVAAAVVLTALLIAVLDRVLRHRRVTIQTLYGAVCAYLLIGLIFSAIYSAFDAFLTTPIFGETVPQSVYSYFSFTTLTTVGFGDYTVKTAFVRRIVAMEAVAGQVFLATTVARLVSMYKASESSSAPPPTG